MSYYTFPNNTTMGGKYRPNFSGGFSVQKRTWKRWANSTGYSMFIPENTQSERISVNNYLQNVTGVSRDLGLFGSSDGIVIVTATPYTVDTGGCNPNKGCCWSGVPIPPQYYPTQPSACPGGTTDRFGWISTYYPEYFDYVDGSGNFNAQIEWQENPYYNQSVSSNSQPTYYHSYRYNLSYYGTETYSDSEKFTPCSSASFPWKVYALRHCYVSANRGKCWENCGPTGFDITYLIVAGGAGGSGSGGGAGGMLTGALALNSGNTYNIIVGGGGAYGIADAASNGNNSSFANLTAIGGGRGGYGYGSQLGFVYPGANGGSGGGGAEDANYYSAGGLGTPGQGNDGAGGGYHWFGGGGGAGAAGSFTNGGNGLASSITGTSVYYAGGGGAQGFTRPFGTGGLGGGANATDGGDRSTRTAGVNTGGGGGGNRDGNGGGNGGSGVVIIRYSASYPAAVSTTGNPSYNVIDNNRIYRFTGSGSITFSQF